MNDALYGNKIAAALLTTLLLAVGLPVVVSTFAEISDHVSSHHDGEPAVEGCPEGLVYAPFDCGALGSASEEGAGEPEIPFVNLLHEADVERGARGAAICSSCHSFDQGGPNGTGPNLWDVVGRQVASVGGYAYSGALQGLGGEWTYEKLDPYLENSQGYVPGTQMAQKIRNDSKRADIIAYLGSLSDDPVPLPEPVAVEEPPAEGEGEASAEGGDPATETPMGEAGEAAADVIDFEAAQPGEATIQDSQDVNERGDDGFPGDIAREGSNYRSSDEDGSDGAVPDQSDAGRPGEDLNSENTVDSGLPNAEAAREAYQDSAPDQPLTPQNPDQ